MNKLDTSNNGGMPIELDDLEWLDDGYRDAWIGLMSQFGITPETSFILSGCVVTISGSIYTTTAGYICLNGEILKVDAHSVNVSLTHTAKWIVEETYDAAGNEQFFDATTQDTYQKRRGKLADTVIADPVDYMVYNAPYLKDVIMGWFPADPVEEDWHYVGSGSPEPDFENSWGNVGGNFPNARFKKDVNGWVHFQIYITGGADGAVAFTLSSEYLPADGSILYPACLFDKSSGYLGISGSSGNVTPHYTGIGGFTCIGSYKAA